MENPTATTNTQSAPQTQPEIQVAGSSYGKGAELLKRSRELIRSEKQKEPLFKRLNDYVIPGVVFLVFILLIGFVFVPFGTEILKVREEARKTREVVREREEKLAFLKSLDLGELETNLESVSSFIRAEMDVSTLASQVEELAVAAGVKPVETALSNNSALSAVDSDASVQAEIPSYSKLISGPFSFSGKFSNLMLFLKRLRSDSSTLLSFRVVDFSRSTLVGADEWMMDIYIDGYLCPVVEDVKVSDPKPRAVDSVLLGHILQRVSARSTPGNSGAEDLEKGGPDRENPEEESGNGGGVVSPGDLGN